MQHKIAAQACAYPGHIDQIGIIQLITIDNLCILFNIYNAGPYTDTINRIDFTADRNCPGRIKRQFPVCYHAQTLRKCLVCHTIAAYDFLIKVLRRRGHMYAARINDTRSAHNYAIRRQKIHIAANGVIAYSIYRAVNINLIVHKIKEPCRRIRIIRLAKMHIGNISLVQVKVLKGINCCIIYDLIRINIANTFVVKCFSTLFFNILGINSF